MRMFAKGLLAAGLLIVAGVTAFAYGTDGSLDAVDAALAESVAAGNASAIKMQGFVRKDSNSLSQDFVTFSKVAREAEKGNYSVLSQQFLADHFAGMVSQSALYGVGAFQNLVNAANSNPTKLVAILKANAKYLAKEGKTLAKYNAVWGNPTDESKVDLDKAAIYYSQTQKLYELINKIASKYNN